MYRMTLLISVNDNGLSGACQYGVVEIRAFEAA